MHVLIVEQNPALGKVWRTHLQGLGATVALVTGEDLAIEALDATRVEIIVLDLSLEQGSALAVAGYAEYRQPDAKVIFVSGSTYFSDGSIFTHSANACACLSAKAAPEDLAALVEYHARVVS